WAAPRPDLPDQLGAAARPAAVLQRAGPPSCGTARVPRTRDQDEGPLHADVVHRPRKGALPAGRWTAHGAGGGMPVWGSLTSPLAAPATGRPARLAPHRVRVCSHRPDARS